MESANPQPWAPRVAYLSYAHTVGSKVPANVLGVRITRRWMDPPYHASWTPHGGQGLWVFYDARTRVVVLTSEYGENLLGSPYLSWGPASLERVRNHFPMLASCGVLR